MQYIDISWPISNDMTTYKNKKDVNIKFEKTFHEHGVRESFISMGAHTGTHIDAPAHFLPYGEPADYLSIDQFNGTCCVIDMTHVNEKITVADLSGLKIEADIVLFKTKNSYLSDCADFDSSFVFIESTAANYLVSNFPNLKAIGIDYLGVERNQPTHLTHSTFFENGVVIIEGLRLAYVEAGIYELLCLPLNIKSTEALPARAILYLK